MAAGGPGAPQGLAEHGSGIALGPGAPRDHYACGQATRPAVQPGQGDAPKGHGRPGLLMFRQAVGD